MFKKLPLFIKAFALLGIAFCLQLNTAKAQTNYAGVFDGSTYISVPNSNSVNLGSTFTIEAWVNYSGSSVTIIDKGNYDFLWSLNANNASNLMGFYNANTGSWKYSTTAVPQNTWTHVAITLSGGTLTFYVNGVAAGTASVTFTQDVNDMNIGRQQPTFCQCNLFNGQMDELRLWSVARTQAQLQANMNTSISPNTSGLVAYYQFNEGSGTTLTDATTNGNTGTWVGNSNYSTSGVSVTPAVLPDYTWTGAGNDSKWSNSANWSNGNLPDPTSPPATITIPSSASNQPVLDENVIINDLVLNGSLSINGNFLTLTGVLSGTGIFKGSSTSQLEFDQPSNSTLNFGTGTGENSLAILTVATGTLNLGSDLNIYTELGVFNGGTLNTNGTALTLKSNATNTAVVANMSNGTVNGNVTVERYIPAGFKAFRELCTGGVNPSTDIFSSWQEGGSYTHPGYGTFITGEANTGLNQNGFDNNTGFDYTYAGNASVYTYNHNGLGGWHSLGYTKSGYAYLDPIAGYHIMIYGDRTPNLYAAGFDANPYSNSTTLRSTGSLVTGDVVFDNYLSNVTSDGSFIANPYAAVIDWSTISHTGLSDTYYYFDPTALTSGGYQEFVGYSNTTGTSNNPHASAINQYIQPGQAFWVQTDGSATPQLTISESNKISGHNNNGVFKGGKPNRIIATLWKNNATTGKLGNIDGAVAVFGAAFTKVAGKEDSQKFWNSNENISITEGTSDLCIDGLPNPVIGDEVTLNMTNLTAAKQYTLRIDADEFASVNNVQPYLQDKFLNTLVALNADSSFVNFTTTADKASYINRFVVVFKAGSALPVEFVNIKAKHANNVNVVSWTTGEETSMLNYEVQKSNNGNEFVTIATVDAKNINNSNYTYNDASTSAKAYYRIKATANNAKVSYSHVVMLSNETKASIVAMPNPVTNGVLNLQMNNVPKGTYELALFNHLGQQVMTKAITATDDNSIQTIRLNGTATGVYTLKLLGTEYNTQLIIKN